MESGIIHITSSGLVINKGIVLLKNMSYRMV